jgi:hypothetical protein
MDVSWTVGASLLVTVACAPGAADAVPPREVPPREVPLNGFANGTLVYGFDPVDAGNQAQDAGASPDVGGPRVSERSQEHIRHVVVVHQNALRACFEIEAQKDPRLRGTLLASWSIDPHGAVSEVAIPESTLRNPRGEGCISRQIRTWRFVRADGTTRVTFPFSFDQ